MAPTTLSRLYRSSVPSALARSKRIESTYNWEHNCERHPPFPPDESGIWCALDIAKCRYPELVYRAYHVVESHEEGSPLSQNVKGVSARGRNRRTKKPNIKVLNTAPTKPSTVFLGDTAMRGVLPVVTPNIISNHVNLQGDCNMPQMYAHTSLQMTRDAGTQNQINPCGKLS